MNERYDNQALREYLLGSLPEAETERFDELSFTDGEFGEILQAAEKDLIDAYIQNELSGAALEKFNTYYLASPLRREKVEFAKAFQIFAEKQLAKTTAEIPKIVETKSGRTLTEFISGIFTISRPSLQWGFALAALVLLFGGVWLVRENSRLRFEMNEAQANRERLLQRETELSEREKQLQEEAVNQRSANSDTERELAQVREERIQLEQQLKKQLREQQKLGEQRAAQTAPTFSPSQAGIASFILAPSLRGGSKIQTVSIPARAATVAAHLELEADQYTAYRAVLRNPADNRILWQSGKLKSKAAGENKRLNIIFPAALLKQQIYSIEVSGFSADGEAEIISDYSFRVVR